jgi:hypothetical protein
MNYLVFFKFLTIITFFGLALVNEAQAYIDPGSGSVILQSIIGALVGALALIKMYWGKIRMLFSKEKENSSKLDSGDRDE